MGIVHPGERNPNWRGGKIIASNGYVLVRVGADHHLADVRGYAYEGEYAELDECGRIALACNACSETTSEEFSGSLGAHRGKRQTALRGRWSPEAS